MPNLNPAELQEGSITEEPSPITESPLKPNSSPKTHSQNVLKGILLPSRAKMLCLKHNRWPRRISAAFHFLCPQSPAETRIGNYISNIPLTENVNKHR